MIKREDEMVHLGGAYTLSHPARAKIVKFLKKQQPAYIRQIAEGVRLSDRLVSFHLSMLSTGEFVESEYGLSNPETNPPRMVKYYRLTPKVDDTLRTFVSELK